MRQRPPVTLAALHAGGKALRQQAVSLLRKTVVGNGPAQQAGNERYFAGLLTAGLPP